MKSTCSSRLSAPALEAEGDLDFRGSKEAPVGFQNIRLRISLDTDAAEDQIATLITLTERYCVVYQTLVQGPQIKVSVLQF
jgi:uncharacterized OsmC-like protein